MPAKKAQRIPLTLLQTIIGAVESVLSELAAGRHPGNLKDFDHVKEVIGFNEYYSEEERYTGE